MSITCPRCGMTSHNPNDERERYCGNCHMSHFEMKFVKAIVETRGEENGTYIKLECGHEAWIALPPDLADTKRPHLCAECLHKWIEEQRANNPSPDEITIVSQEKTILLVEDNPDDEELALRALKRHHVSNKIVVVRDGVEALDYFYGTGAYAGRNPENTPAVTLLDLKLPKINGMEVLQRVRADPRTRLAPIVIFTSSREEQDIAQGYANACNSYMVKPVDFDKFLEAVRQLGVYWLLLNEPPQR